MANELEGAAGFRLIWIDLEMTGLLVEQDEIIEIATVVTDGELNEIAVGPVIAVHQEKARLDEMDAWNTRQHNGSGLVERVLQSKYDMAAAEAETLAFLREHVGEGVSPMCGNSICQDRRFLARQMPTLEAFFHYRNLDVTSLKILANMWAPAISQSVVKSGKHLALDDIRDSIAELKHYRDQWIAPVAEGDSA